jgi:hypothetical protein
LLGVDALSVVAYRAVCSCGWQGPRRDTYMLASAERRAHEHDQRAHLAQA